MKISRKHKILAGCLVFVGLAFASAFVLRRQSRIDLKCVQRSQLVSSEPEMASIFPLGSQIQILENYYACNQPRRGDIVMLRTQPPILRIVRAIGGDKVETVPAPEAQGFSLKVNGDVISVAADKSPQIFAVNHFGDPNDQSVYAIFHKEPTFTVNEKHIWVFSGANPGNGDSSNFGPIARDQLVGRALRPVVP